MENRLYQRVPVHLIVFLRQSDTGLIRVRIQDVSIGGLRVTAPPLRRNMLVEIIVPRKIGVVSAIGRFKAYVVWAQDGQVGLMECEDDFQVLSRTKSALVGASLSRPVKQRLLDSGASATGKTVAGADPPPAAPSKKESPPIPDPTTLYPRAVY